MSYILINDPDRGLCIYKGNYVGELAVDRYYEKFIIDAYTGNPIAQYAELNGRATSTDHTGRPITHTLEEFGSASV